MVEKNSPPGGRMARPGGLLERYRNYSCSMPTFL